MTTCRSTVSWVLCCVSLVGLAGCFGKGAGLKVNDGSAAGKQGDAGSVGGGGASGGATSSSGGKIATDGGTSNGGAGGGGIGGAGNSGTGGGTAGTSAGGGTSSGGMAGGGTSSGGMAGGSASSGGTAGGIGGGGTAAGGNAAGGSGSGGTGLPDASQPSPDAPLQLPFGAQCTLSTDCALGNCVDGVCCQTACTGCNACKQTLTGQKDGTCAPVVSGQDPHDFCADQTATNQCGYDGMCDGAGACRYVSTSHICTPASCSADNKTYTFATNCNGTGACATATTQNCGAFQCATTGCLQTCAKQTDCGTGNYCNIAAGAASGTCAATKSNGVAAVQTFECTSGVVADGVCCNQACSGCSACTKALNGQTDGQCLPVPSGQVAHSACTASGTSCGLDGFCDGTGKCRYPAQGTSCGSSCTGSTLTTKTCDGAGTCGSAISTCGGSLVCASATACKTTCTLDTDCVAGDYCASGTCTPKLANGAPCSTSNQCPTGNTCVEGVCCSSACGITCKSCLASKTGGSNGTCAFVTAGTTCGAGEVCSAAGNCGACNQGTSCPPPNLPCKTGTLDCSTGTPVCNATGNYPTSQSCGPAASCNSTTKQATPAQMCDGNGNCPNVNPVSCPYGCNGTVCATAKPPGTACGSGTECGTGFCTNGVCCSASSCPKCQACNLNGAGTCSNVALGTADPQCQASAANCLAGGCDGAGNCSAVAVGTSCGNDVCTNGAEDPLTPGQYTTPTYQRRVCDGAAGSSHCVLGSNQGCNGDLTCASATACRTVCARDADCISSYGASYYCAGVTCLPRNSNGVACTNHNQCLSRVCNQGTCAQCASDDDCPVINPSCCSGTCSPAGYCDDNYSNGDGSLNCQLQGICGSRHSVCTGVGCGCGSVLDCPNGSICKPGSPAKCLVNGGQPCVQNSDCLSGTCTTSGLCATSLAGAICDNSGGTTRPTGCSTANCDDQNQNQPTSICY